MDELPAKPGGTNEFIAKAFDVPPAPDEASADAVAARVADILRPAGALARLDELAVWLARWQATTTPAVEHPRALIFAADHGVTAEGVSAYPTEVTGAMMAAFEQGKASISAMAAVSGAKVRAIDVGVGMPTGNIRTEPAMDGDRFLAAFTAGWNAVEDLDQAVDLLIVGEMGIGNTTAAAAVCSVLLDRPGADTVGAGTGLDGPLLQAKIAVVDDAVARAVAESSARPVQGQPLSDQSLVGQPLADQPLEVLRQLGGAELVALAGAMVAGRHRRLPVVLDGYVTAAPALAVHRHDPAFGAHFLAGHVSAERGHRLALEALGLDPLLDLGFRLGEASGAMAALPLFQMACRLVTDVPTFTEWFSE